MCFDLLQWKPFKIDEKCFLFHVKDSFCSWDIYIFVLTFCLCTKNWLDKKPMVNFKFHIAQYLNNEISSGQSIKYNMRNIFLGKSNAKFGGEDWIQDWIQNQNWIYFWTTSLKCFKNYFYCMFKSSSTEICNQ